MKKIRNTIKDFCHYLQRRFLKHSLSTEKQKTIREEIDSLSDEQLIDKDMAFGIPTGPFGTDIGLIDTTKKLMEIFRRSSKTQTRANSVLIGLTLAMVFVGVVTIMAMGYQIHLQLQQPTIQYQQNELTNALNGANLYNCGVAKKLSQDISYDQKAQHTSTRTTEPRYITDFYKGNLAYTISQMNNLSRGVVLTFIANMDESNRLLDLIQTTEVNSINSFITSTDYDTATQVNDNYNQMLSTFDNGVLVLASTTLTTLNILNPQFIDCPIINNENKQIPIERDYPQ